METKNFHSAFKMLPDIGTATLTENLFSYPPFW